MSNKKDQQQAEEPEVAGLEVEDQSTNQESVPVPYFAGKRRIAGRQLTKPYNQYAKEAPTKSPKGK